MGQTTETPLSATRWAGDLAGLVHQEMGASRSKHRNPVFGVSARKAVSLDPLMRKVKFQAFGGHIREFRNMAARDTLGSVP
jgi:hypothetical protein